VDVWKRALGLVAVVGLLSAGARGLDRRGDAALGTDERTPARAALSTLEDDFATSPFDPRHPRWCERYHHGHWEEGVVRLFPSGPSECEVGPVRAYRSCEEKGCSACDAAGGSPCAKAGDPRGNAVIQTVSDQLGTERVATAIFTIERALPVGGSHLGLYVAFHPHCHGTVQSILVPDGPGVYHLNVAMFNEYIGGDRAAYRSCLRDPVASISPPLAESIELAEGRRYRWTLRASLESAARIVTSSELWDDTGTSLAHAGYVLTGPGLGAWFGAAGGASRFAFGAQFSRTPSPSGGSPALRLLEFRAAAAAVRRQGAVASGMSVGDEGATLRPDTALQRHGGNARDGQPRRRPPARRPTHAKAAAPERS
jgi:hypothetical protein